MIHIIRVKFGISSHPLMPERELTLLPWSHVLFFPASSFTCSPKVPDACCRALVGVHRGEAPEMSCHPGVAMALEDGKNQSPNLCLGRFAFGFVSSSPNLSILDCSRVWAGAGGEMDV